jgi:transposase
MMRPSHALPKVYLCREPVDMRKAIDGMEETSEQLSYIPATMRVLRHVRYKYACPRCENGVKIAPLPPQPIPKSVAAPSLLAHVTVLKYADALPLYRQSKMLERIGIDLPRATKHAAKYSRNWGNRHIANPTCGPSVGEQQRTR